MTRYYFLAASLPPLVLGDVPDISFEEFISRLQVNLRSEHYKLTKVVRRLIDVENIRRLLRGEPLDGRGNLNEKELDEALLNRDDLSEYIFDFFHKYETPAERLSHFSELVSNFFREKLQRAKGFLFSYLSFERELRLILTALRAKKIGRDLLKELQFEDLSDPFVIQILSQKDGTEFLPSAEYAEVKEIMEKWGNDPLELHKKIEEYRYKKIDEMAEDKLFTIDSVLSYMVRLIIIENWMALNEEQGALKLSGLLEQELQK